MLMIVRAAYPSSTSNYAARSTPDRKSRHPRPEQCAWKQWKHHLPPSPSTIVGLIKSATKDHHHGYQSYKGIPELRNEIAKWYHKIYGVTLNPDNEILPLIGSKEGIMHISMSFLNQGDKVLVPNPGYPTYTSVSNLAEGKILYYDLDEENNWAVDIKKLENTDLSGTKIMWINYPNMPTGAKANLKLFERLVKLANDHKFLICNDNPYSLILNKKPLSILQVDGAKEVALELNSLSKSHNMAGWRMGWVSGRSDYISTVLKFKSNMDSGMFLPLQHAAIEALSNTEEWHSKQNEEYTKRRRYVYKIFDLLKCTYKRNQAGLFIWAKIPDSVPEVEPFVEDILQKANVFITPGFIFGSNGNRYVRISLCSKPEILKNAILKIKEYIGVISYS